MTAAANADNDDRILIRIGVILRLQPEDPELASPLHKLYL